MGIIKPNVPTSEEAAKAVNTLVDFCSARGGCEDCPIIPMCGLTNKGYIKPSDWGEILSQLKEKFN